MPNIDKLHPSGPRSLKLGAASLLLAAGLCAGGCAAIFAPAPELAHLTLATRDSAVSRIDAVRIDRRDGGWVLSGRVVGHSPLPGPDATASCLRVTLFDAAGRMEREIPLNVDLPLVRSGRVLVRTALFRVNLESLPAGTARIEIRACVPAEDAPRAAALGPFPSHSLSP